MKKKIVPLVIGLVIIAVVVILYKKKVDTVIEQQQLPDKTVDPFKVSVLKLTEENRGIENYVFASGTLRAVNRHLLYFEYKGKITFLKTFDDNRDLKEGDKVKKGDVLAKLDTRDLEEDIISLEANVKQLTELNKQNIEDVARYTRTFKEGGISLEQLESKRLAEIKSASDLTGAKTKLKQAKLNLEKAKIVSPVDGVIAYINVKEGDFINGAPTSTNENELMKMVPFVILEDDEMELTVSLPAIFASQVKNGQKAFIYSTLVPENYKDQLAEADENVIKKRFKDYRNRIEAEVYSKVPVLDTQSRSFQVKVRCRSKEYIDGEHLSCQIITDVDNENPVIPFKAILFENRQAYCFVKRGDKAIRIKIDEFGLINPVKASVKSGLKIGDEVIVKGQYNLTDNVVVEVVK